MVSGPTIAVENELWESAEHPSSPPQAVADRTAIARTTNF